MTNETTKPENSTKLGGRADSVVMRLLPVPLPEVGRHVCAIIKNSHSWTFNTEVTLVVVDEDDVTWRFIEDGCELSYDWDVIYWEYADA